MDGRMTHALKTWPEYFKLIENGSKNFELREADRPFEVGDKIILQEYDPDNKCYTGNEIEKRINYILYGPSFGLKKGHCIISLNNEYGKN
jgi:hypothetical protein